QSRDLYREAAERAAEALAVYRESAAAAPAGPPPSQAPPASPLRGLTRTLERFRGSARTPRPDAADRGTTEPPGSPAGED
ncbi:hypothetical protein ACN6LL_000924, partial [Streptomyces violaceoruber]